MAEGLQAVNDSGEITPQFNFRISSQHPSIFRFEKFYNSLGLVLRTRASKLPPNQIALITTPPTQSTVPADPTYSSGTDSTTSHDSKHEHYTDFAANDFVWATFQSLEEKLDYLAWYRNVDYSLKHVFVALVIFLISRGRQLMVIRLGETRVQSQSDGGLTLFVTPKHTCSYPMFCQEVTVSFF
jgi:hypothetical protein